MGKTMVSRNGSMGKRKSKKWGKTSQYDEKIQRDFEDNFLEKFLDEWDSELDKTKSKK